MLKIKNNKLKHRIMKARDLFLAGLVVVSGGFSSNSPQKSISTQGKATATVLKTYPLTAALINKKCSSISSFVDSAKYVRDTTVVNKYNYNSRLCLGRYIPTVNKVYMKYFVADTIGADSTELKGIENFVRIYNSEFQVKSNAAHEFKHQDNHLNHFQKMDVSPEQFAKLCMHNEISANINSLLYQRELYLKTGDINVFENRFKEYKKAVKAGIVDPSSTNPMKQELEKRLIMKTVPKWWEKNLKNKYEYITMKYLKMWFEKGSKKREKDNEAEYQKALDVCYSFIMDGKIVNLNYFNHNRIKDMELTPKIEKAIAQGREAETLRFEKIKQQEELKLQKLDSIFAPAKFFNPLGKLR